MEYLAYLFFILASPQAHYATNPIDTILCESVAKPINNSYSDPSCSNAEQFTFEDSLKNLYQTIGLANYELPYEAFKFGMIGYFTLRQQGRLSTKNLISIIDFTKSSCKKRFYTIDLDELKVKFYTYVSHGKNTGEDIAQSFSNTLHSNQSSLGFYVTAETYFGTKGYSLKLDGVEKGYNDNMRDRAVIMHDADYVSEKWIKRYGRLGRSQGCPALPKEVSKEVIDAIKHQTAIFAYYNDAAYLQTSSYLNLDQMLMQNSLSAKLSK